MEVLWGAYIMKCLTTLSLSVFLFMGLSGAVLAADVSIGEAEYQDNCATCHGAKGNGGGPFAEFLKAGTPGLTTLSKDNGGVFPFESVYQAIDGRSGLKSHGSREMPIWGKEYIAGSVKTHGPFFGEWYGEDIANARILALIDYISTLQEK